MAGLLKGVKVIESAMLFTGDYTGQLLADEEADIIKLEAPGRGDYLRDFLGQVKPHKKGHSPMHITVNRNKRSVTVNLKSDEGKDIFWKILKNADVFIDGNMPGATEKLGIGYEDQKKVKPDIIYGHVTGLGATGPYSMSPTHGLSMNALAGTEACAVDDRGLAVRVGDGLTGAGMGISVGPMYLAYGIAAALYRREKTGKGTYLEVGCSDAVVAQAWISVINKLNADKIGADASGMPGPESGKSNFYETKDGRFLLIWLIEQHFWENFCRSVGRPDLIDYGNGSKDKVVDWGDESLRPILRDVFLTRTLDEWMEIFAANDCAIVPASQPEDLLKDKHLLHREVVVVQDHPTAGPLWVAAHPIKVPGERYSVYRHAPALGEHTDSYLADLGYTESEIADLKRKGIV